ncbi:MAG: hypothetical protein IJB28_05710, partial [Bacteroidaceae bacterium]|nr:hypothetical protein [Bacteroidaceae bacterium]
MGKIRFLSSMLFGAMMGVSTETWAQAESLTVTIDTGESVTLIDADGDNHYDIGTADELYAFAAAVNNGNSNIGGELTTNIVINKNVLNADGSLNNIPSRSWTPIGSNSNSFNGSFNGNNYTISGLYCSNPDCIDFLYVGLFGYVRGRASRYKSGIRNLGVIDSYFQGGETQAGQGYTGGVVAYAAGAYNQAGGTSSYLTIENCYNASTVKGSNYVGGIAGLNGTFCTLKNCYNVGRIEGTETRIGGIAGVLNRYGSLRNSYNVGTVKGDSCYVGGITSSYFDADDISNCYYLLGCTKDGNGVVQSGRGCSTVGESWADIEGLEPRTDFVNGEVAYLLQGEQEEHVWGQNINNGSINEGHPVLGGAKVYGGYLSCSANAPRVYTNDETIPAEKPAHVEKTAATCTHGAVCQICGEEYTEPDLENHVNNTNERYTPNEDGLTHSLICSECHTTINTDEHSGGTVTCTHGAICEHCETTYTEPSHAYGEESFCDRCGILDPTATEVTIIDGVHNIASLTENMALEKLTYTRTLNNLLWNALYVPFEIPVSQLIENYDIAYINAMHSYDMDDNGAIDKMEMEVVKIKEGTLHANYPYLIRAKNEEAKAMEIVVENSTLYAAESV